MANKVKSVRKGTLHQAHTKIWFAAIADRDKESTILAYQEERLKLNTQLREREAY